ncbi:MAG: OmpA family protein [Hyphomonas sp.]
MAIRSCLLATAAILGLAACTSETPAGARAATSGQGVNADECVPIADGMYEMRDGRLLATSMSPELAANNPALWVQEIEAGLAAAGIDWLGVVIRDQVAVVTGTAPDAAAKAEGFSAGQAAIEGHPRAGGAGLIIVDGISIEDGEEGVGAALATLAGQLTTAESCQTAFDATSRDRTIQFGAGNANISPVSLPLIDALGGVAILCRAFPIEIGTHTDTRGADDYNLRVSQERADAIRAYLLGKGLAEETLTAVGYGETQPVDTGSTAEAHARNRRTVFTVKPR